MSEMKTGFKLPAEFHEAIGDYRSAIRSVKAEIRELEKEAKAAAKAGTELSADKKDRLATLQDRQTGLEATRDQAKAEAAAGRDTMSGRVLAAQQGAARAASVASGRIGIADVAAAGGAVSRLGAHLMKDSAVHSAKFRAGAAIAQAGGKAANFARFAGAPVAVGAAIGYAGISIVDDLIKRQRAAAAGAIETGDAFLRTFTADRFGSRYSAADLERFTGAGAEREKEVEDLVSGSSLTGQLYDFITGTRSVEAMNRASASRRQAESMKRAESIYGQGFERAASLEKLKKDKRVQRAVERERLADYKRQAVNKALRAIAPGLGDLDIYDIINPGGRKEAEDRHAEQLQEQVKKTWKQLRADEKARLDQDTDLQVSIRDRASHLRAIEIQDITERTSWSKY